MTGRLIDLSYSLSGKQRLTVELDGDFQEPFQNLKEVLCDVEIKKHREKRSRDANAYFHVLVTKMAAVLRTGNDELKKKLVVEYGTLARGSDGQIVGIMLPDNVDVTRLWEYTKPYDHKVMNGKGYTCYLIYKQTREMNTQEMSRLIDGTVSQAKELGIETATPEELERMKNEWRNYGI